MHEASATQSPIRRYVIGGFAFVASTLLAMGALVGVTGLWLMSTSGTPDTASVEEAMAQEAQRLKGHLQSASAAIGKGQLVEAAALLEQAHTIPTDDPQLIALRSSLARDTRIRLKIRDIQARAEHDPSLAMGQATALLQTHPNNDDVANLVQQLRAQNAEKQLTETPEAEAASPKSKPAPRGGLLNSRIGRNPGE